MSFWSIQRSRVGAEFQKFIGFGSKSQLSEVLRRKGWCLHIISSQALIYRHILGTILSERLLFMDLLILEYLFKGVSPFLSLFLCFEKLFNVLIRCQQSLNIVVLFVLQKVKVVLLRSALLYFEVDLLHLCFFGLGRNVGNVS